MTHLLRAWTDRDIGSDRQISRAIYPEYQEEPRHPAWFPAQQLGAPREYTSRYVVREAGTDERVAYATLWELRPRRYRFDLAVRPGWQRQGIGTQLLDQLMSDAHALGATGLQARVRDDKPEAFRFVARRGFQEVHRMGAYRLDFAQADVSRFQDSLARLRDRGLAVTTLAAIREEHHYLKRFHELYSAAREGWPDPDPDPAGPAAAPLEQVKRWLDEARLPEAFFIAKDTQKYVAFTSFFGLGTAVHPEYRRQGIATLLKAGSIAEAHGRGLQGQTTSTASTGMRKVLESLGYRRLWSEVRMIRTMERS